MDDMHRLTSSIIILSLLSFPAFAVTDPGVEHPLSGITYAPPSGEQRPGSVASDGNDFVAVWSDITIPRQGVYATHIGAHGEASVSSQRLIRPGSARDLSLCYGSGDYVDTTPSQIITGFTAIQIGMAFAGGRLGLAATSSTTLKRVFINPQSLAVTKLTDVASGGQEVNVVAVQSSLEAYLMNFNLSKLDIMRVPLRDN